MAKVNVEFECGCFQKSEFENGVECSTRDEALAQAREMVAVMREQFCAKHTFSVQPDGDDVLITVKLSQPAQ